jgi:hypothetical protein
MLIIQPPLGPFLRLSTKIGFSVFLSSFILIDLSFGQITSLENLRLLVAQSEAKAAIETINPAVKASANPNVFYLNPGPWGRLRCAYIYLEAPKSLMENFPLPSSHPRWGFAETLKDQLPEIFRAANLSQSMITALLDPKTLVTAEGNVYVFPTVTDLMAMTPESRSLIYTELAKNPVNEYHVDPVLIVGPEIKEWFRTSKLRAETIALIEQLSYKRGETTAFSDVSVLMNSATSDADARAMFKAMTRTRSIIVKLEVDHDSNLEELTQYWSPAFMNRHKDIEPLIQSIIDTDGIEALPLSHLLPARPRKLAYTYPDLDLAKHGRLPDCHWTSLNFFNYDPHEYLLDERLATNSVLEHFTPVEPPYQYGDVLFFLNAKTGDAYHSCIHLADNLVYTKNGRNLLSPWIIMRREDLEKVYLYRGDGRVQGFRRKPETP